MDRSSAIDVIRFLDDAPAVASVETISAAGDGSKGTARIVLTSGQRFYITANAMALIDTPDGGTP